MKSKPLYQRAQTSSKFLTGFTFIRLCDLISHWTRKKSLIRRHSKKIQMHGETRKYEGMKRTYWYVGLARMPVNQLARTPVDQLTRKQVNQLTSQQANRE
jgi:hypothetical protein